MHLAEHLKYDELVRKVSSFQEGLTVAEGDSPLRQIVGGKFQGDFIACQNADAVPAEATRQMGQNNTVVIQLNAEQTAGEFF